MAKNKENITLESMNEWMGSLGFLFPRNKIELARFERMYANFDHELSGSIIDPETIMKGEIEEVGSANPSEDREIENWRMAARNFTNVPDHILRKMKKNQDHGDSDSEEEKD